MSANKILSTVRVGFAVLFLWLVLAGNWVNLKNESKLFFKVTKRNAETKSGRLGSSQNGIL